MFRLLTFGMLALLVPRIWPWGIAGTALITGGLLVIYFPQITERLSEMGTDASITPRLIFWTYLLNLATNLAIFFVVYGARAFLTKRDWKRPPD